MDRRWLVRGLVVGLHAAVLLALLQHRPPAPPEPQRRLTTVRLVAPAAPRPPPPRVAPSVTPPRSAEPPSVAPAIVPTEPAAQSDTAPPAPPPPLPPAEPPRTTLRLTLPPGYAASSAAARNPALSDPRSNTPRPTLEERIADATGGAGAWVEERTSEYRSQSVGALGDRRTVMRRGDTCVEIFRSRIADMDAFNGNVAPRTVSMVGKPYKCK